MIRPPPISTLFPTRRSSDLAFSFMYALLNERNNAYLKKIINTDPNTQVYNEYQLNTDLNKELVRANRQGSQLFLISIAIPEQWNNLKVEELEKKLSMVSRGMRRCCVSMTVVTG